MNTLRLSTGFVLVLLPLLPLVAWAAPTGDVLPDDDVIMRAMVDELSRSMTLQMEDLEKPYFIQFTVDDGIMYQATAAHGAIEAFDRDRSRRFYSLVRVGSTELDNTNFSEGRGFFGSNSGAGRSARLPLENEYAALRQAMWWTTDGDYKGAVETLTKKRAYMEDKTLQDRPNDFSSSPAAEQQEPAARVNFDPQAWKQTLARLSSRFIPYHHIQDSKVQLLIGVSNVYIVNSEGTRVRKQEDAALLTISAETQATDGMRLSDSITYSGRTSQDLPGIEQINADIEALVTRLTALRSAPQLEQYTGPVWFDGQAGCQVFRGLLAGGVAGKAEPVGQQRAMFAGADNLEKRVGQRILPRSFKVYDDPTAEKSGSQVLLGHYRSDDEGVPAQRVDIVNDGTLVGMAMSRAPTKKLSGSNGHSRRASNNAAPAAAAACLFVEDTKGVSRDDLKARFLEAVQDAGLEYGLKITSISSPGLGSSQSDIMRFFIGMQQGNQSKLGDPVYAYKVYPDGREQLVRGLEFGPVEVKELKDIIAAGNDSAVHNYIGLGFGGATPPTSIVAPPLVFEELELAKIDQELDKLPILKAPAAR